MFKIRKLRNKCIHIFEGVSYHLAFIGAFQEAFAPAYQIIDELGNYVQGTLPSELVVKPVVLGQTTLASQVAAAGTAAPTPNSTIPAQVLAGLCG